MGVSVTGSGQDQEKPRAPEPLTSVHELGGFDSGVAELDDWLRRRALKNEGGGAPLNLCRLHRAEGYCLLLPCRWSGIKC